MRLAWYLFTGPLRAANTPGGQTNINVNPAPTRSINVNLPSQPNMPAPGANNGTGTGNNGTGGAGGAIGGTGGTGNNPPPPANP